MNAKPFEEKLRQDKDIGGDRIIDVGPQVTFVHGLDGTIICANGFALDYSGITDESVHANDFIPRLFHPDDAERVLEVFGDTREHAAPFELELRMCRYDGQYRWFSFLYSPLFDVQNNVSHWFVTGTAIGGYKYGRSQAKHIQCAVHDKEKHLLGFDGIVGSSIALRKVLAQVDRVAPTDSTVLIQGESGTGKELIARTIHNLSNRSSGAFVSFNCAAIAPTLISAELFGHEKGAFTGALQRRAGRFELANGGTIFLDEVGDLPAETQIALLRVLQEREIERVGGRQPIGVDVRVVAASNRDLERAMATGVLRPDLFYRLNVVPIHVPPLRERVEDIPILAGYFIERYTKASGKKIRKIPRETEKLLQSYDWPGNIRELQNVIERAVVLCDSDTLFIDETWLTRLRAVRPTRATLAEQEKQTIQAALESCNGQVAGISGAAAKLGLPRQTLESKIKALGIDKNRFKIQQGG